MENSNALANFTDLYMPQLTALKDKRQAEMDNHKSAGRDDEAKFSRVQINIIEIFEKMYQASAKRAGDNLEKAFEFYLGYFEQIPKNWHTNLEECERFGAADEAHIERLKIAEAEAILDLFNRCRTQ